MKKIAIVSDIHGNIAALEKVAEDIARRGVERVYNLGDHASGPLWPTETLEFMMKQGWTQILGNHDRNLVSQEPGEMGLSDRYAHGTLGKAELEWLKSLPTQTTTVEGMRLFHGTPGNDNAYLLETMERGRARLATATEIGERLAGVKEGMVLSGHSHIPRVVESEHRLVINPGSVGLQAYDDELPEKHVMETGSVSKGRGHLTMTDVIDPIEFDTTSLLLDSSQKLDDKIGIEADVDYEAFTIKESKIAGLNWKTVHELWRDHEFQKSLSAVRHAILAVDQSSPEVTAQIVRLNLERQRHAELISNLMPALILKSSGSTKIFAGVSVVGGILIVIGLSNPSLAVVSMVGEVTQFLGDLGIVADLTRAAVSRGKIRNFLHRHIQREKQ